MVGFQPDEWKSPVFYAAVLETHMYINVFIHVAFYILIIGFHVVLPLLRMTVQVFEEAARTMAIPKLEVSPQFAMTL